ncbi:MAG: Cof-type HAD-IIB family hydrolase [Clostridiaceae bacterium]|nr:Cof-type HAD-IIB family hydrolase [Clostridiaceae bacterium]MBW4859021.1 Cof-type HAD-IIB family hydrolase [Clostridiaceae bacterium]MBW4869596.1 Cof-type HAD-IIB family hydrolase [Clostridiaceae bacterium]
MKYKLIAIDMDGTLLNSKNEISKKNKDVIKKVTDKGVKVVLSTGRIFPSALHYAKSLEIETPIISCNGAYVVEHDKLNIIYEKPISVEVSKEVINLAEKKGIYYHFYDDTTFFARRFSETVNNYYKLNEKIDKKERIDIRIIDNPIEIIDSERPLVYKFVFVEDDREKLLEFRKEAIKIDGIEVASSWWNNVEIMNKGVSKGRALIELCNVLNIDKSEVVAIGDNENDIPMLKIAGLSVAMGNGEEEVKKIADVVTKTNDESGVGEAIEKFVL